MGVGVFEGMPCKEGYFESSDSVSLHSVTCSFQLIAVASAALNVQPTASQLKVARLVFVFALGILLSYWRW